MKELPPRISAALEKIKESHSHYVDVKVIKGRCYVYESTSVWDKKVKRIRKLTKYLGRITEAGEFIPSNPRNPDLAAAVVETYEKIESAKREILPSDMVRQYEPKQVMGKYDADILRALSTDGRITLPQLGKEIELSATGAEWQRNNVEKRYGVKYIAEIDVNKLGYLPYIVLIKFENNMPSAEEIKKSFEEEPLIQMAMLTRGDYDLMLYILVENTEEASVSIYELMKRGLYQYRSEWYVVPAYISYNFVPLRDIFFEMLKSKIWHRGKESLHPKEGQLLNREYAVLHELNGNGTMDFTEIDKKYGFDRGRAQYTYHKLQEKGIIKRITINMQSVPVKYTGIIFTRMINATEWDRYKKDLLNFIIKDPDTPMNRYNLVSDVGTPYGVMFILPVFSEGELEEGERELTKILKDIKIRSLVATNLVIGTLCNRKLDKKASTQYYILVQHYGLEDDEADSMGTLTFE